MFVHKLVEIFIMGDAADHAFATAVVSVMAQPAAVVDGRVRLNSDLFCRACLQPQTFGALWDVQSKLWRDVAAFFARELGTKNDNQ
jgi:hypothetical protein